MKENYSLHNFFSDVSKNSIPQSQQLEFFALLNLGLVQSLASGILSATEAIQRFYNAENCLYVRKHLTNKTTDTIMSYGVQLPDIFDSLPAEEAQREFFHELETMRSLCLNLLEKTRSLDSEPHTTG